VQKNVIFEKFTFEERAHSLSGNYIFIEYSN